MITIKELRERNNWTQVELAEHSGVSFPTVSRAENGHPVSKTSLKHISKALGVSLEELGGVCITQSPRFSR